MYNSYFGFPESPFAVTPDPRFFYTNTVYQEAFAALHYGIEAKKGFIVVTGQVGTGKTTLLRKLMRNLGDTIHSVFIFNTLLSFSELLQLILQDLGLPAQDPSKVTMLQQLNDYLIKQLKQGHVVSVLVDEAQHLSDEALEGLRLLSNLETDQEKLIQIVLMGQPELKAKLDQPGLLQLKQRVALQSQLTPLRAEETGPYIDFRLRAAGYKGKELFQPDAVERIAFYSQGIPRVINIICDNVLLNAYAESKKVISAPMIDEVGRELRLGPVSPLPDVEATPAPSITESAPEAVLQEAPTLTPRLRLRHAVRGGAGMALIGLLFVALASMIDPQNFRQLAAKRLEAAKYNLTQWVALASNSHTLPAKVVMPVEKKVEAQWKPQRVLIQHGSTISKIVNDTYGENSFLALDIIKEFNPQIKNLNWVFPGQELVLPPLTQETMLRRQPDGFYRLIVASFSSQKEADQYARRLSNAGYRVLITQKRISDDLLLHRVEIDGLKNLDEANQIVRHAELSN